MNTLSFDLRLQTRHHAQPFSCAPSVTLAITDGLRGFLEACRGSAGHLYIASPFWSQSFLESTYRQLRGMLDGLTIFCSSSSPVNQLSRWTSRLGIDRAEVRVLDRLHGKLYIYRPRRGPVHAFVGSQNATHAALSSNVEFGVELSFERHSREAAYLEETVEFLYRTSRECGNTSSIEGGF
jgi:hypothetical protein